MKKEETINDYPNYPRKKNQNSSSVNYHSYQLIRANVYKIGRLITIFKTKDMQLLKTFCIYLLPVAYRKRPKYQNNCKCWHLKNTFSCWHFQNIFSTILYENLVIVGRKETQQYIRNPLIVKSQVNFDLACDEQVDLRKIISLCRSLVFLFMNDPPYAHPVF